MLNIVENLVVALLKATVYKRHEQIYNYNCLVHVSQDFAYHKLVN